MKNVANKIGATLRYNNPIRKGYANIDLRCVVWDGVVPRRALEEDFYPAPLLCQSLLDVPVKDSSPGIPGSRVIGE